MGAGSTWHSQPSKGVLAVVVAVAISLAAGLVQADNEKAREHFDKGKAFYNLAKYKEALAEFESAYLSKPDPLFLFNIAQCHRQAGNNSEALRFYKNYLREIPEKKTPHRVDVEKRVHELEDILANEARLKKAPPSDVVEPSSGYVAPPPQAGTPAAESTPAPPAVVIAPPAAAAPPEPIPAPPVAAAPAAPESTPQQPAVVSGAGALSGAGGAPSATASPAAVQPLPAPAAAPGYYAPAPLPVAAPVPPPQQPAALQVQTAAPESKPFYTRPLFWGVVGAAAVAAGLVAFFVMRMDPNCPAGFKCH